MPKPHIPNYILCCTFGELEVFFDLAHSVEEMSTTCIHSVLRRSVAQRLRIKFEKKKAENKLEYKISLLAIDALALCDLMLHYKPHAKGPWQQELFKKHIDLLRGHYNEYVDL